MSSLGRFPTELVLAIAKLLRLNDLNSLLRANHRFAYILTPLIHDFARHDKDGLPAICWAAKQGHSPLVRLLLNLPPPLQTTPPTADLYKTPLIYAAERGDKHTIQLLLTKGANINQVCTPTSGTALTNAIKCGNIAIARLLLRHGADPNVWDGCARDLAARFSGTALHVAAAQEPANEVWVEMLLENGAEVNARDQHRRTALHIACMRESDPCVVVKQLLRAGIDINAFCEQHQTALWVAVFRRNEELVKLLLDSGANTSIRNNVGSSVLHMAVHYTWGDITKVLLEAGADIAAKNRDGLNSFEIAKASRCPPIMKMLSEYSARKQREKLHGLGK
ncbi:Ankyrin repeat domain-containing protein 16 [Maublancomyces gigas]|uniref:Ankyrin repeat domain-containing protein 16 n=1 Tax=Discina gigas TaxID=1032678 RepID=A0ABR3GVC0_9PEZI